MMAAAAELKNLFLLCLVIIIFTTTISTTATAQPSDGTQFTFNGFNTSSSDILLDDSASILKPTGALQLTSTATKNAIGRAFHRRPIRFPNSNATSFATTFVFAIAPPSSGKGGFGLAFVLSPATNFPGAEANHYLGLFNSANNGDTSNHIFAVEFDTVNGVNDARDTDGNHVGINVNSMTSSRSKSADYIDENGQEQEVILQSGDPIQAWIEYDAVSKSVNVTLTNAGKQKPTSPLLTFPIDLTTIVKEDMYVGFSASTGDKASSHYILGWSFGNQIPALPLNISLLPPTPEASEAKSKFKLAVIALIAALCVVTVALLGLMAFGTLYKRFKMRFEILEDWELECPHRFSYRDLYSATRGFSESEIIGIGGFGSVYRATFPNSEILLAVKKITRNSIQGIREFSAEIESLGRLRHKNLVNLQGWCKHKNDLLLVYDYIPNGSLDFFLYRRPNGVVLTWEQRFKIVKGIAAGLLYLHEEWEQVVIHRDVKSSNVLIDGEMNGRLGDFGLARLYDHGTASYTTNVVGTVGYIAPEMARTGKASTRSDVFAFGVLLLEIVTGKRPIDGECFILVDWVMEMLRIGDVLEVADVKLGGGGGGYAAEEVKMVLGLGLVCSHPRQECRPTMREVVKYLDGEEEVPAVDEGGYGDVLGSTRRMNFRLMRVINNSKEMNGGGVSDFYSSSSIGGASVNSIYDGR
ncbi:Lectin-domain containing receptor kinase VI.3 [Linum grandiflorum]